MLVWITREKRGGVSFWVLGAIVGWGLLYFNAPVGGDRKLPTPSSSTPTHTYPPDPYSVLQCPLFPLFWTLHTTKIKPSCHLSDLVDIAVPLDFLSSLGLDKIVPMGCHWNAQICGNQEDKSSKRIRISVALCSTGCQFWGWEWFETIFIGSIFSMLAFARQTWCYLHGRFHSSIFYYPSTFPVS